MKSIVLLVTWVVYAQSPNSYQVTFTSMEACETARKAILQEAERLKREQDARVAEIRAAGVERYDPPSPPSVSAICVAQ
jgi:hypothetical protein